MKRSAPLANSLLLSAAVLTTLLLGSPAHAATLANWRFESGGYLADSVGSHTLSAVGTSPSQITPLPVSGDGSKFSNPIPQTGASNNGLADFGTSQSGNFSAADTGNWMGSVASNDTFTLEAFVNLAVLPSASENYYVVSQYTTTGNQRSFSFGIDPDERLKILLSSDGTTFASYTSTLPALALDTDYYIGVSFDAANTTSGLTFYLQDSTNSGSLQSLSTVHSTTGVFDSTADVLIGSFNGSVSTNRWKGYVDEARISDTVLSQSQLLISVPEPSSYVLLMGGMAALLLLRRRHALSK